MLQLCAAIILASLGGCDSAPGPASQKQSAPVTSSLSFSPASVDIDSLPPALIVDGIATFSLTVTVSVSDADEDLNSLYVFVLPPDSRSATAAESVVSLSRNIREVGNGNGVFNGNSGGNVSTVLSVSIPSGETGTYTVKVYASDDAGQLGNQATGSLPISASSRPPVVESIEMPATVDRPASGEPPVPIVIVARVSDPDGLENILRVEVTVNGSAPFSLCDDGSAGQCNAGFPPSGDVLAGDGLFTLTIQVDATNALGDNIFSFKAIDRSGLESEPVERTVTVQ